MKIMRDGLADEEQPSVCVCVWDFAGRAFATAENWRARA